MSLSLTLNTAVSGLQTQQASLQIVSNNIANASTEGFTRKTALSTTRVLNSLGAGVELSQVQRTVDETLLRELRETFSQLSTEKISQPFFRQIQDLFGKPGDDASIGATITDLAKAMALLSSSPEGATEGISVINAALDLTRQLNTMSAQIQTLRGDAEQQIGAAVLEVNGLLSDIDEMNNEIKKRVISGDPIGEFEDKRDVALNKLAEKIDISTFERTTGEVIIFGSGGVTLLDSVVNPMSHTTAGALSASVSYAAGTISGITISGRDITNSVVDGELKGLIDLRDTVLPGLQAEIDQLAGFLRDEINALQNQGASLPPLNTLTGSRAFVDPANDTIAITGKARFAIVDVNGKLPDNLATAQPFEVDFDALPANATIEQVRDAINTAAAGPPQVVVASVTATGQLQIDAPNANHRLVIDSGDSQIVGFTPFGGTTETVRLQNGNSPAFSHFFGLNDFFSSPNFLTGQSNITGLSRTMTVKQSLVADPALISKASAAMTFPLQAGSSLVTSGDNTTIQAMAAKFDEQISFGAIGNLTATTGTLANYAAEIVFENATAAARSETRLTFRESLHSELDFRAKSVSGVNVDEEMGNMIVIQQAYSASARLVSTVQEMFDILEAMV